MTDKFCTVDQAKSYNLVEAGYSGDDGLYLAQVVAATQAIKIFTRREWVRGGYVDYFDTADIDIAINQGRNYVAFSFREKNVEVTESYPVVKYHTGGGWDDAQALPTTTYSVDTRKNQLIMYPAKMTSQARSLRVAYTAGYEYDDVDTNLVLVPSHIATACAIQASFMVNVIVNDQTNSKSSSNRAGSRRFDVTASGLVQQAQALVRQEVRLFMGSNA